MLGLHSEVVLIASIPTPFHPTGAHKAPKGTVQTDFTLGVRTLTTEVAAIEALTPNQFWEKESLRSHSKEPFRTNEEDRRWQIELERGWRDGSVL